MSEQRVTTGVCFIISHVCYLGLLCMTALEIREKKKKKKNTWANGFALLCPSTRLSRTRCCCNAQTFGCGRPPAKWGKRSVSKVRRSNLVGGSREMVGEMTADTSPALSMCTREICVFGPLDQIHPPRVSGICSPVVIGQTMVMFAGRGRDYSFYALLHVHVWHAKYPQLCCNKTHPSSGSGTLARWTSKQANTNAAPMPPARMQLACTSNKALAFGAAPRPRFGGGALAGRVRKLRREMDA